MAGLIGIYTTNILDDVCHSKLVGEMANEISYTSYDMVDQWGREKLSIARVHLGIINPEKQPIFNEDNSICIFMDGEVFDYASEKRQLIRDGHVFKMDNNDAEYCLHLYEEHGTKAFVKLNGSYIIVIYHIHTGDFLLISDRISSRPLFYFWDGKQLVFGSQVRPLLKCPDFPRSLDEQAILEFFTFSRVLMDKTFYQDVKVLPAASILHIRDGELSIDQYWKWEFKGEYKSKNYYVEAFTTAMEKAVERRLKGNHRFGLLLSGGLDSRTVLAADKKGEISVAFTLADFDNREVQISRKIAATKGCRHVFLQRDMDHYYRLVEEAIDIGDGLYRFWDAHNIGFFDQIRPEADVLLHGYGFDRLFKACYVPLKQINLLGQNTAIPVIETLDIVSEGEIVSRILQNSLIALSQGLFNIPKSETEERLRVSVGSLLRASSISLIFPEADKLPTYTFNLLDAHQFYTYLYVLHNRAYIDERTIAFDNDLIELALSMPTYLKIKGWMIKSILPRLSLKIALITNSNIGLPAAIPVWPELVLLSQEPRFKKLFHKLDSLPHPVFTNGSWPDYGELIRHSQNLNHLIKHTIEDAECLNDRLFNIDTAISIYNKHLNREADYTDILFLLLTFGRWHKKYGPLRVKN